MLEDRLLLKRFKNGSVDALGCIYEKYENYLLTLAGGLLGDCSAAEDVLHDVFCNFIRSREKIKLRGNLKGYLGTCVVNLARDRIRSRNRGAVGLDVSEPVVSDANRPDQSVILSEESRQLTDALGQLPYEQREIIIFHLRGGMKFRQIADMQSVSANTIKSRYRYGLDKLRTLLNSEVNKNEISK
jgi:RNA polymerase sigma factor (sigma-70 family)